MKQVKRKHWWLVVQKEDHKLIVVRLTREEAREFLLERRQAEMDGNLKPAKIIKVVIS